MNKKLDPSFNRLMQFAKNHRPRGGFSNMYLLQTKNEKGDGIELSVKNGGFKGVKVPFSAKKGTLLTLEKPQKHLKSKKEYL